MVYFGGYVFKCILSWGQHSGIIIADRDAYPNFKQSKLHVLFMQNNTFGQDPLFKYEINYSN